MKLLVNGTVLTFDEDDQIIENGGVAFTEEKIEEVGRAEMLKKEYPQAEIMDAEGCVIMPGLINAHMHFYSTFARGMDLKTDSPPADFVEILEKLWWRLDDTMASRDDIYYSTLTALIEGIKSGTTAVFDHHASYGWIDGSLDAIRSAVEKAGIRASLSFEISDRHGREKGREALEENIRFLQGLEEEDRSYLNAMMGLHASFTIEDETLAEIGRLAEEYDLPCHLHVAEGKKDVEDSQARGYENVVERLDEFGILRPGTLAIHGVHLTPAEFETLAARDCYLVHNPESNMSNAVGAADLLAASRAGVDIALGTDGYTADMWESLKVANLVPTHQSGDPRSGGGLAESMLFSANPGLAGEAFSLPLGRLEAGAGADMIVLDYSPPTPLEEDTLSAHLLMGMSGGDVRTTIARGQILMHEREVQILDYDEFTRECREQARDFWRRF